MTSAQDASGPAEIHIRAEHRTAFSVAQIARFDVAAPYHAQTRNGSAYRVDMSLTPRLRNSSACYSSHWRPERYETLGSLYMLPPEETLCIRSEPGAVTCVVCELQPQAFAEWLGDDVAWTDRALQATLDVPSRRLRRLLWMLDEELRSPGLGKEMMVELLSAQIALEIGRCHAAMSIWQPYGGLSGWRLRIVEERIVAQGPAPTLSELAMLCKMSVRQLTRAFRASHGKSIGEFMIERRMDKARHLLKTGKSVKAVARDLGFGGPSGFTYAFRKSFGITPREFRIRDIADEDGPFPGQPVSL